MLSHRTEVKSSAPSRAQRLAHTGDLFYQTVRPYQKNNYLFEKPDNNYVFSTGYAQMRPYVDGYFLLSLVQSERFVKVVLDNCTGTSYPAINANDLAEIEVAAPSDESEAQKIGTIFRSIDNLITLHQRQPFLHSTPHISLSVQLIHPIYTSSWEQRKAKELFVSTADKGYPELPVLSATQDRGMIRRDENSINIFHDKKNEAGYKRVLPGQFVIHLRSFQGGFAHSAIEGITSPAYTVFGFSEPEKHDSEYWKYVFTSKSFIQRLETVTYGIRDGRSISYEEFLTLGFVYPSKAEQTAIARYLDKLSDLITLHQRECISFTVRAGGLILTANKKRTTSSWEQRKLGDIGETYTGLSGKTKADFGHGQARFVTYMNVFSNPISNPEMTEPIEIDPKQNEVEVGDVLFTTSSETPEEVGMSSVLLEKRGKTYLNSFCFGFRPSEKIDSYYLAYMLRSESAREKIILLAQGISRYNISKNKVMEIAVSLPSLDEQKLIGQYFRQLDHLITLHQRKGKAAVTGCSNDANNSKGVCCKARDFGYKCHKKDESQ